MINTEQTFYYYYTQVYYTVGIYVRVYLHNMRKLYIFKFSERLLHAIICEYYIHINNIVNHCNVLYDRIFQYNLNYKTCVYFHRNNEYTIIH